MNYRIWFHPLVARDLDAIAHWILDYAGPDEAARKLGEIEAAIATLKTTPHKGSLRDEIAPGLRAIPAGRKSVIAFVVDDDQRDVLIYALMAVPIGPCAAARAADDSLGPKLTLATSSIAAAQLSLGLTASIFEMLFGFLERGYIAQPDLWKLHRACEWFGWQEKHLSHSMML